MDRSSDVLVASSGPNGASLGDGDIVRMMGSLPMVTVYANKPLVQDGWIRQDVLDDMASMAGRAADTASTAWQAYSGAMAGEFNAVKDAVVGVGSWVNDSLWQLGNLASGGLLAKATSQVEQANYRQAQRGAAMVNGMKSVTVNAGLTLVDPLGQSGRAWSALSAEAGRVSDMYKSGDVRGAFERGARDLTNAALLAAPMVGPTARVVGTMTETAGVGLRLAVEDVAATRTAQLAYTRANEASYRLGLGPSYAVPPEFSSRGAAAIGATDAISSGSRTVVFQRSDLSVSLNAGSGEGAVFVNAAGEKHTVGLISVIDGSPQFYLDNRVITSTGERLKLKLDGGSLTQAALEETISSYKRSYGKMPPELSGSLADSNLANFKTEFSKIRSENFVNTDQFIADKAIRNISFGANRINIGYGNLTTQLGNFNSSGIPMSVFVRGLPGIWHP